MCSVVWKYFWKKYKENIFYIFMHAFTSCPFQRSNLDQTKRKIYFLFPESYFFYFWSNLVTQFDFVF